jgi:putative membrane protein
MASMPMTRSLLCLAASAVLCGAPLYAQTEPGMPGSSSQTPGSTSGTSTGRSTSTGSVGDMQGATGAASMADKDFVQEAMQGDMAEIQLAQLAQQKASSEGVKQFAQRMITDHTKLDAQIKPIAQQLGVTPPANLDSKHKALQTKLEGLSGAEFDKEYIKAMVTDHREDLSKFRQEASSAQNPELKNAASQASPIIAEHLKMAENLEKNPNATQTSM